MIAESAAFVLGAWWLQQQSHLPGWTGAVALVPLAVLGWWLGRRKDSAAAASGARLLAILVFTLAGFFWAAAVAHWKLSDALDETWEGRDVELRGVVAEMTQPFDRGVRFRFDVEQVYSLGAAVPSHISLAWYQPQSGQAIPDLQAGQRWRLAVRLRRPHGTANPEGFDFEAWMLERGIRATGYVLAEPSPSLLSPGVIRPDYLLESLRESIRAKLLVALDGRPYAGVIVALAIGDQRAIPPPQWQVFTRTGVNHLMSISGLHITMVASLVFLLVLRLWRWSETLVTAGCRHCAQPPLPDPGRAPAYAALSGFAVPAQRTVYMLAVVAIALWIGWSVRPIAVLAAAAAVVVAIDPMAVISPGFWLSFGAVAVIMLAAGGRIGSACLVPRMAAHPVGGYACPGAVVCSRCSSRFRWFRRWPMHLAIPLVSLVVVPLALLAAVLPLDSVGHRRALRHERLHGLPAMVERIAGSRLAATCAAIVDRPARCCRRDLVAAATRVARALGGGLR